MSIPISGKPILFTPHFRDSVDVSLSPYDLTLLLTQNVERWEQDEVLAPETWPGNLTEDVIKRLLVAVEFGATERHAVLSAGITPSEYQRWKGLAKQRIAPYFYLFEQIEMASSLAVLNWLGTLERASTTDPKWSAWKLERRYPEIYGARQVTTLRNDPEHPLVKSPVTSAEASSIVDILRAAGAIPDAAVAEEEIDETS